MRVISAIGVAATRSLELCPAPESHSGALDQRVEVPHS